MKFIDIFRFIEAFQLPIEFCTENSFESTSFTQIDNKDSKEKEEKVREFKNLELVWVKQISMPWFPG